MTNISAAAAANREQARETNGQFGQQTHSTPGVPSFAHRDEIMTLADTVETTGTKIRALRREIEAAEDVSRRATLGMQVLSWRDRGDCPSMISVGSNEYEQPSFTFPTTGDEDWDAKLSSDLEGLSDGVDELGFVNMRDLRNYGELTYDLTDPDRITVTGGIASSTLLDSWPINNPHDGLGN